MKIGYESAKKNFALCPESPTGLKWLTVENKLKGDDVKPGDHVGINQRWKRGYLPVATIRNYLKKAQREDQESKAKASEDRTQIIKKAALKAGDGEIDFRRQSEADEVIKSTLSSRFELSSDGTLVNRMDFRGAVKGKPVISELLCVNLNFIRKDQIVEYLKSGKSPTVEMTIPDGSYYRDALKSLITGRPMADIMSEQEPEVRKVRAEIPRPADRIDQVLSDIAEIKENQQLIISMLNKLGISTNS